MNNDNEYICVASLQKGPHVAIYQRRENRSQSIIYQFSLALDKIISRHFMLVNIFFASFYILFYNNLNYKQLFF